MTSRAQVEALRRNQRRLVSLAVSDLNRFWTTLDLSNPAAARDALLAYVPELTDQYGEFASVVASDWFEEVREAAGVTGRLTPELGRTVRREVVQNSVRYAAGGLFTDVPERTLAVVSGSVDRYVKSPARDTIRRSGQRDGAMFARVPTGSETCAFCFMVASRGFAYHSEQAAAGEFDRYHDECVIGSTLVSGPYADAGYRRYFEGEVVTLVTAAGHELTITPKHPVLTDRGWVRAGDLQEGDNLVSAVSANGNLGLGPDVDQRPPRIEDVVRTLGMVGPSRRLTVPGAAEQFHGDGFDAEVNVVARYHLLRDELDSTLPQPGSELDLHRRPSPCSIGGALGATLSDFQLLGVGANATAGRDVRGLGLSGALTNGHALSAQSSRLGSRAHVDARLFEPTIHDAARDAVLSGEGQRAGALLVPFGKVGRRWDSSRGWVGGSGPSFDPPELKSATESLRVYAKLGGALRERLAGAVHLDRLIDKRIGHFSGHVFNLSTREGWYSANSITVSNCDCQIVPSWERSPRIEGYNPDAMYGQYLSARGDDANDTTAILSRMREMYDMH